MPVKRRVEHSANYQVNLQKFLKPDKSALRFIMISVERKPLDILLRCTSAREMWTKLNSVFDMKSAENLSIV